MKIPKKLEIIPILEALFEIRFETTSPEETNTGIIYNCFKDDFDSLENFPIMNLPSEVRNSDEKLKYQPYQRMQSKDGSFVLQYGQRQLSLHCVEYSYDVFENFKSKISEVTKKALELGIIEKVNRVGLRYTDFLNDAKIPGYSFDELNISIDIAGMSRGENFSCSSFFNGKSSKHRTQIYNTVEVDYKNEKLLGDLVDLDSYIDDKEIKLDKVDNFVSQIHNEQKEIFFGILGEKVTNLLGPTYE